MIQFVIWHLKKLLNKSIKCSIPIIIICFPFSTVYAKEGVGDKWRNIVEQNPEERLEDNWEIKEDTSFFDSLNIRVRDEEYPEKTKIYRWDISSDGRIAILLDSVNILEIFDNNGNYIVGFDIDYRDDIQIKFADDNNIYLEISSGGTVIKINAQGMLLGMWNNPKDDLKISSWDVQVFDEHWYYLDNEYRDRIVRTDLFGDDEETVVQKKTDATFLIYLGLNDF